MAIFTHSVLEQNSTVTANTVFTADLPVNPLSFIILTTKFFQNKADVQLDWDNVDAMIDKVEVLYKGSPIYSSNGSDLEAVDNTILGFEAWICNRLGDDNERTWMSYIIPLGRRPYDPRECFPRSVRGELQLQITWASSFTDIDNVELQIETVELPEATPERYMRITTLSVTPTAAGEMDVELPIGNTIAAVLFWGTTVPSGSTATRTLQYSQLLLDNQRTYISQTNFESWRQLPALLHKPPIAHGYHIHQLDGAAYAQYMDTSVVKYRNDRALQHQLWDFDPLRDGTYLLDTGPYNQIVARIYAGDTNALRVLPVELINTRAMGR